MSRKKVLVTGLSGVIGTGIRPYLGKKYELSALNRRDVPGVPCYRADIADLEAIKPAFEGKDVVVHLAAVLGNAGWADTLRVNLVGCYNVFEASRLAAVKRIVFASSGAAVWGYENDFPYNAIMAGEYEKVPSNWPLLTTESAVRPHGLYGASKVWGEALGRYYSEAYRLSVICLRFGRVRAENRPVTPRDFSVWCSLRDAARMVERCIDAPESVGFDVFYVVSDNQWRHRDIEHARQVVGYNPEDSADSFRQNL